MGREMKVAKTPQTEQNLTKKHVYLYTNATPHESQARNMKIGRKLFRQPQLNKQEREYSIPAPDPLSLSSNPLPPSPY